MFSVGTLFLKTIGLIHHLIHRHEGSWKSFITHHIVFWSATLSFVKVSVCKTSINTLVDTDHSKIKPISRLNMTKDKQLTLLSPFIICSVHQGMVEVVQHHQLSCLRARSPQVQSSLAISMYFVRDELSSRQVNAQLSLELLALKVFSTCQLKVSSISFS